MNIEKRNKIFTFAAGALMGLCVFLILYGFSPLDVTNDTFLRGGYIEQDAKQHYAGWLYYRNAPLSIPFCNVPSINWPQGMSIAFTDSIPLFAVIFRLLSPILPATFQYFGLFAALCFMLQGGFASLLLSLFTNQKFLNLLGTLPFILSPVLIERTFRHTSLTAHFFILAAIYYYLLSHKQNRYQYKGLFLLNCLAITIHPYFVPMTFAITFALLIEYCVRNSSVLKPLLWLFANLLCCFAAGWLFGTFSASGSGAGGSGVEYGYFSMNLNALWNPTSRGNIVWSRFLPVQNQVGGNYDAFNYLGLGIMLALLCSCVYCVIAERHHLINLLCRFWGAAAVAICLTLFSITHIITANGATLLQLPLPHIIVQLATTLRSSGRMFWPVYYGLMLFAVAGLLALGRAITIKRAPCVLLSLLCIIQIVDLSPALIQKFNSLRHYKPAVQDIVTGTTPDLCAASDFFLQASGKYQKLAALDQLSYTGISLALYTADEGMINTDTSFFARYDEAIAQQQKDAFLAELQRGSLSSDTLYVTEDEASFLGVAPQAQQAGALCGALQSDFGGVLRNVLYVIAPGFSSEQIQYFIPFNADFPVHLPDFSDDHWDKGVLSLNLEDIGREADKNRVIFFADSPFIRERLSHSGAIVADGVHYSILSTDDRDEGTIMVTLDIEDAHILIGKDLTFSK